MDDWHLLTKHGRVLVCIAHDPRMRLREIAEIVEITERSAYAIVGELAAAGYVEKLRDGRRNRYVIQAHLPVPDNGLSPLSIGEALEMFLPAQRRGA